MKKTNVLDILFVALMFLFLVAFPFDLWIKSSFYLYLAETLARFIFVVFLLMYNHFKKLVTIPICHFKKTDLFLLPLLPILFCNFYYLLEMRNGFQITLDETFFIQIFFQISVALSEELLFRSLIQNCLSLKKTLTRIFVSSLIFALFHLTYFFSSFNLISLFIPLYTFGLGFLLGFIYEWSEKNFLYICGYHFLFNLINQILYTYMLNVGENYLFYVNAVCVGAFGAVYLIFLLFLSKRVNKSFQR